MQIEIIMGYHYMLIRISNIKNDDNAGKVVVKLGHGHIAGGTVKWGNHSGKQVDSVLRKAKHATIIWPAIALLGIYPGEVKTYIHKKTCTLLFVAALFLRAQNYNSLDAFQWVNG